MRKQVEVFFKGCAMGAADLIPGVSGGSIAFITGIYTHLITCIQRINPTLFVYFQNNDAKKTLQYIDFPFLVALGSGILFSIILLSRYMYYLISYHSVPLSAFFAGLISASALVMIKELKNFDTFHQLAILIGCVCGLALGTIAPSQGDPAHWLVFVGGMLAICAMILPGISGSFILLIMGLYGPTLEAIHHFNFAYLGVLALGACAGLLSFVQVLSLLLEKAHDMTFALMIGLMLGFLYKMWPWKLHTILIETDNINYTETMVSPFHFARDTGGSPDIGAVSLALLGGILCALLLYKSAQKPTES
jgi:putative membrane protein